MSDIPAAVNQRKRLAFLALLAASGPRGIARERLLLLLWPESTTDRARGALYQLLYVVRQAFGEESVVGTDELHLDPNIVESDVSEFNEAVARGDLAAAVDLYAGPFLDAFHLSGAPELERWVEQKRQELARSYESALAQLVAQAMERRDYSAAIAFAERLVAANPLSERATVLLMEALAASGRCHRGARARACARVDREAGVGRRGRRERQRACGAPPIPFESHSRSRGGVTRVLGIEESGNAAPEPAGNRAPRRTRAIAWAMAAVIVAGIATVARHAVVA